jgi:diguanylate cyclase
MAPSRLYGWLALTVTATAVLVASAGLAGASNDTTLRDLSVAVTDGAAVAAGMIAAIALWHTARRREGTARRWRVQMALGMTGWTIGQVVWAWHRQFGVGDLPMPAAAHIAFLAMPVLGLAALLTIADGPSGSAVRWAREVLTLDSFIVVGSLFILVWTTTLSTAGGAPAPLDLAAAMAHPAGTTTLAALAVLISLGRTDGRAPLLPLGLGLAALAVSGTVVAQLVGAGRDSIGPVAAAGFIAGPALIALSAFAPDRRVPEVVDPVQPQRSSRLRQWLHVLLPYVPVAVTGTVIVVGTAQGRPVGALEIYAGWLVIALVVARQLIITIDNLNLLERVTQGQERLAYQAFHDPLTGLANLALFRRKLARAVERHRREGRPVALLFVDLDDFKQINDSLGHAAGDRLLGAVGARLRGCVRTVDSVARVGGDEFALLLDGGADSPERVGERILAAMHPHFVIDGHTVQVGASVGVVVPGDEPALSPDALLRRADAAMYASKRRGKGTLVRYRPQVDDLRDVDLPNLLAGALATEPAHGGFDVHYQPIVRLDDGSVTAVEALARWRHPVAGAVEPALFVGVAERAGLVARLDDFVLDRACADACLLGERYGREIDVHVNISASRLASPELEEAVTAALVQHDLPAQRLVLEITETSRICDLRAAAAAARRLRQRGVRLALDDFGTGFNALAQLHALPVDVVKLDRVITAIDSDPDHAEALCRSVIAICDALGITVVAEGVESDAQAGALAELGCTLGQGFRYGSPEPLTPPPAATAIRTAVVPGSRVGEDLEAAPRG